MGDGIIAAYLPPRMPHARASLHPERERIVRRHLRWGWWGLSVFVLVGLSLETLLGLRIGWYVDDDFATRRLMFTLGHAHGALVCLVNVGFALTVGSSACRSAPPPWVSGALIVATVFVPAGFLGGGVVVHDGDPGLAIVMVPIGAVALLAAALRTARAVSSGA